MINRIVPNPKRPRLGIRLAVKKPIGCAHERFINLKISGFNVVHEVSL
jgi:hypothetical protein